MIERRSEKRKSNIVETFNRFEYVVSLEKVLILEGITEYYRKITKYRKHKEIKYILDYLKRKKQLPEIILFEHEELVETAWSLFEWQKLEQFNYDPEYIKHVIQTKYISHSLYHIFGGAIDDAQIIQLQSIIEESDFELNTEGIYFSVSINLKTIVEKKVNKKKKQLLSFLKEFVDTLNYAPAVVLNIFLSKQQEAEFLNKQPLIEDEVISIQGIFSVANDEDQVISILHDSAHVLHKFPFEGNVIKSKLEETIPDLEKLLNFYNNVLLNETLSILYAGNFISVVTFVTQYVFMFERAMISKGVFPHPVLYTTEDPRFSQTLELEDEEFEKSGIVVLKKQLENLKFHQTKTILEQFWIEMVIYSIEFWSELNTLFIDLEPEQLRKIYARLKFGELWPNSTSHKIYDHLPDWFNELISNLRLRQSSEV